MVSQAEQQLLDKLYAEDPYAFRSRANPLSSEEVALVDQCIRDHYSWSVDSVALLQFVKKDAQNSLRRRLQFLSSSSYSTPILNFYETPMLLREGVYTDAEPELFAKLLPLAEKWGYFHSEILDLDCNVILTKKTDGTHIVQIMHNFKM